MNCHEDLLHLNDGQRVQLCREIREFLVDSVSQTGGHLAGNLGVVELTVAIETVFNTAEDRLVFDVGHQSYVHKLLTGRRADFPRLRQFGGISGFPKPSESNTDAFVAGHASNSVSIALGMARARTLMGKDYHVIALLGDGAATGGMAFEGLNDAAVSHEPMLIILNDNEMSIGRSEGGLSRHLSRIRSSEKYLRAKRVYREVMKKTPFGKQIYIASSRMKNRVKRMLLPATIFENMGFTYLGPVDGHNLPSLISLLRAARDMKEPVVLHVVTKKGCGYSLAEADPARYHGIGRFDAATGKKLAPKQRTYSDQFGDTMIDLAARDRRICAITAAMPGGTGLLGFMKAYPERYFDVGIAEEHAVSMAGGLAKQGMVPVVAVYSTFLQRAFDQILEDVCMLHLHVVFAIDRAGLVGDDGPTHHGVFDVGFLRIAPGMLLLAPASLAEERDMLCWAVEHYDGPVAIRYPRGGESSYYGSGWTQEEADWEQGTLVCHSRGSDITLLTYGSTLPNVLQAAELLEQDGISVCVLRLLTLSVIPTEKIFGAIAPESPLIVVEETAAGSGIWQTVGEQLREKGMRGPVIGMNLGVDFVPGGSMGELYHFCGLNADAIAVRAREVLCGEN